MKTTITLSIFIFLSVTLFAQQFATTESGQKVKLNDDGTWEIVEENGNEDASIEELANKINTTECKLRKDEVDEFTGNLTKIHKVEKIGKSKTAFLFCYTARIGETYALYLYNVLDNGCVSTNTTATIKFSDGEILTLNHVGDIKCGASAAFILDGSVNMEEFLTKSIDKIRLTYTEGYMDFELKEKEAIQKQFACMVKG